MLNVIGHKNIFLTVSALLVGAAVLLVIVFGFRQGIDFSGGALWQFSVSGQKPSLNDLENIFKNDLGISEIHVAYDSANSSFLARLPILGEADHQKHLQILKEKLPSFEEMSFQSIGPSVGRELRNNALIALGLVLVGISFYIAFAFRKVYRPVSSWKYGVITLITLFHDVAVPAGMLALLGHYGRIEIDGNFIVALLVIMGFSVHDTIVVFDRIRENLFLDRGKTDFETLINQSVNQTMARSINTSLTLILVLLAIYFVGPAGLHYFVLTLLVGVSTGIYSSIFVASPLLVLQRKVRF
ncbi:MAG: protein translocase subunit SecF [Candidatus Liptonbacteria bacterium]|nr:protein translocase subunit SecF [Candidatus Liptonbacteria bacterium]